MMYYKGRYALGRVDRRRVPLTDFGGFDPEDAERSLPKSMCDETFNFAFDRGRLTDGVSFSPFRQTLDDGSAQALPVPQTQYGEYELFAGKLKIDGETRDVLFASESQKLSYLVLGDGNATWQTKTDMSPGTFVSAVGYVFEDDDLMLFAGRGAGVYILSGSKGGQTVANALPIRDIRTYRERVFAVVDRDRPCVWFSDTFDPYDWSVSLDAGGYIYTDGSAGKVLAIVPMNDFLFVICEYGLYRLTAYSDQSSFTLKRISSDTGRIFAKSAVVCGDSLVFAALDGLYGSDGYGVRKLTSRADGLLAGAKDVTAVYWRGKYLACFDDGKSAPGGGDGAMFALDLDDGNIDVSRGLDFASPAVLRGEKDNKLLARSKEDGAVLAANDRGGVYRKAFAYWHIGGIDLGLPCDKKRIVQIECKTSAPITIAVIADGERHEFVFAPAVAKRLVGVSGYEFEFEIVTRSPKIEILPPLVTIDVAR